MVELHTLLWKKEKKALNRISTSWIHLLHNLHPVHPVESVYTKTLYWSFIQKSTVSLPWIVKTVCEGNIISFCSHSFNNAASCCLFPLQEINNNAKNPKKQYFITRIYLVHTTIQAIVPSLVDKTYSSQSCTIEWLPK